MTSAPAPLGRGVVVTAGAEAPLPWRDCARVVVDAGVLAAPAVTVATLHEAWAERRPVVVELQVPPDELRQPDRCETPPYALDPGLELWRDRLQFLVWANNYDARSGDLVWWHARKAARRLAGDGVQEGGPADLVRNDGTPAFVDGGPSGGPAESGGFPVVHRWETEGGSLRAPSGAAPSAALAPDQLAAVAHGAGPARIVAPAGSGKTRVLTERLRHLLVDRAVHPATVTAVAFNTRAADELRERCGGLVTADGPHIRTLNSLGLWICNELGGNGRLRVLDELGARDLVEQIFEVRRQSNTDTVVPFLDGLSAIRLGLSPPGQVAAELPDAPGLEEGFDAYRAALSAAGAVDFDEQIYRAIEILLRVPQARARAQERCRRMLVDELQDLTPAHVLLIRLLAAPAYDCFGVGDDDQVIYGYTGADPRFLIDYGRFFPGATEYALEVNYRCPPSVVTAASTLLSYNRRRVHKTIRPAPGRTGGSLAVRQVGAGEMAGEAVRILREWRDAGVPLDDVALLARVNVALLPVQVACIEAGVACTTPVGADLLRRTGIRTALAYLRIALDPARIAAEDVAETIRRPSRGVAPKVVEMLTRGGRGTSLADVRRLAGRLTGRDAPKLADYAEDLALLSRSAGRTTADLLRTVRHGIGLDQTMDTLDSSRAGAERATHGDDLGALEAVARLHPDPATFEAWLRDTLGRVPPDGPCALLSTVHRIKGREWGHVVVFGAEQGLFPHRLNDDEEGERRVFHVALTRGREEVVVLAPTENASIFVPELDGSRPHPPERPPAPPTRADRTGRRAAPDRDAGEAPSAAPAAELALRVWRREAARRAGVPAYVILHDRDLSDIARRHPRTLGDLARCPGIGAIRLERWGDEIVAVLQGLP